MAQNRTLTGGLIAWLLLSATAAAAPATDRASVSYAGGVVRLSIPSSWNVSELPVRDEIRLVLTPGPVPQRMSDLTDGMWLSFRYREFPSRPSREEVASLLARRLCEVLPPDTQLEQTSEQTLSDYHGLRQRFVVLAADSTTVRARGTYMLFASRHGLLDIHIIIPEEAAADRKEAVQQVLDSLKLADPVLPMPKLAPELADSAGAIGTWKANDFRLTFGPAGRVAIVHDGAKSFALDANGYLDYRRNLRRRAGTFSAAGDILKVVWEDGSLLNYRWLTRNGRLYLTDHYGRVSRLERLLGSGDESQP